MHPKFDPLGIRTHDLQIMTVHFMSLRCLLYCDHSAISDLESMNVRNSPIISPPKLNHFERTEEWEILTLSKRIKVPAAENKNWKYGVSHCTTKIASAMALFGENIKIHLPEIVISEDDDITCKRDLN